MFINWIYLLFLYACQLKYVNKVIVENWRATMGEWAAGAGENWGKWNMGQMKHVEYLKAHIKRQITSSRRVCSPHQDRQISCDYVKPLLSLMQETVSEHVTQINSSNLFF